MLKLTKLFINENIVWYYYNIPPTAKQLNVYNIKKTRVPGLHDNTYIIDITVFKQVKLINYNY